ALPPPGGDRRGGGGDARREVGRNAVRVRGTGRPFLFSRPTCDCGLTWRGSTWWSKHSFNASDCEIPPCRAVRPTLLPPPSGAISRQCVPGLTVVPAGALIADVFREEAAQGEIVRAERQALRRDARGADVGGEL